MHYLQTVYSHKIKNKCIQTNDQRKNNIWQQVTVVQSVVTKSNGIYTYITCDGAYVRAVFSFNYRNNVKTLILSLLMVYSYFCCK